MVNKIFSLGNNVLTDQLNGMTLSADRTHRQVCMFLVLNTIKSPSLFIINNNNAKNEKASVPHNTAPLAQVASTAICKLPAASEE